MADTLTLSEQIPGLDRPATLTERLYEWALMHEIELFFAIGGLFLTALAVQAVRAYHRRHPDFFIRPLSDSNSVATAYSDSDDDAPPMTTSQIVAFAVFVVLALLAVSLIPPFR